MTFDEFKSASSAKGLRNKIEAVDRELKQLHRLDAQRPRDYAALLAQLRRLFQACETYKIERPGSDRQPGVDKLKRQIALEEVVLTSLADYHNATDDLEKWEHLETTQERYQSIKHREDFQRAGFMGELDQLISGHKNRMIGAGNVADAIRRDIEELKRIATAATAPDIIKAVILEATAAENLQQLDMCEFTPGAKYNTTRGKLQKYTLNHMLNQSFGKKMRMGSLLHELTHISIAETFGNTVLMLAIDPDATDAEIMALARVRKGHILGLKAMIDAQTGGEMSDELVAEMKSKVDYPLCGKFGMYLANFKPKMDPAINKRLSDLQKRGLDCELIEYDTVINQMMLWCHLYGVDEQNAVYRQLQTLARLASQHRSSYRGRKRRIVSPVGHSTQVRSHGRRMSIG